jgi:hypothetical protein
VEKFYYTFARRHSRANPLFFKSIYLNIYLWTFRIRENLSCCAVTMNIHECRRGGLRLALANHSLVVSRFYSTSSASVVLAQWYGRKTDIGKHSVTCLFN